MRRLQPLFTTPPLEKAAALTVLAAALTVLADPARLQLLSLLASFPDGEACNGDLTRALGRLSQPTVSHHLEILTAAGLITRRKEGTRAFYRLQARELAPVIAALSTGRGDPA